MVTAWPGRYCLFLASCTLSFGYSDSHVCRVHRLGLTLQRAVGSIYVYHCSNLGNLQRCMAKIET